MSTISSTDIGNQLVTMPVKDFMLAKGFVSVVSQVRVNTNGYPYITFINANNEAENIYFSKKGAELVKAGQPIIKGFFSDMLMAETKNAEGETRWKISTGSNLRATVNDLF